MSREIIVDIDEDGTAHLLYTEALDLREVGHLQVERASFVVFDTDTQSWFVRTVAGEVIGQGFPTRSAAIAHEVAVLQARLWSAGSEVDSGELVE